jgi:hypothetical protein
MLPLFYWSCVPVFIYGAYIIQNVARNLHDTAYMMQLSAEPDVKEWRFCGAAEKLQ